MTTLTAKSIQTLKSPLAQTVEVHEALSSTQERARELAREGTPHGTLVVAKVQTGGRGRLGRRWGSPKGGLWMSLVLRPEFGASLAPRITQTAAVGVAKALWELGVEARIKWPNDLLVDGKKICGILAESSTANVPTPAKRVRPALGEANRPLDYVVLGIGLNANLDPASLEVPDRQVATLREELAHDVDLLDTIQRILTNLDAELNRIEEFAAVLEDWRALNCTLGERVRVQRFGETLEGRAVDLSPDGTLLLETPDRTIELYEGEIEHLRQV